MTSFFGNDITCLNIKMFCKKMTDQSLVKIGEIIGKRDHSTVIHGIEKIEKDLDKDPELSKVIDVITKKMD